MSEQSNNQLIFVPSADLVLKNIRRCSGGKRMFTVTDENVARLHPEILPENDLLVLPAGEDGKTFATAENVCRKMLESGLNRNSIAVAIGGGVIGDITGFAASVYMRGIDFINVPTTLLSQVDSAIGGKTGVNLDGYKNMIGSFKMPNQIIVCPELLSTLPEREWRCGMGELIKTAVLSPKLYEFMRAHFADVAKRDALKTEAAVKIAAQFKKQVTDDDPTEKGRRAILNLGHTVGHALEKCDNHKLSHGEYVMLGLIAEFKMTDSGSALFGEVSEMLNAAGMPDFPDISAEEICEAAKADKKNGNGKIVVLGALAAGKLYTKEFTASAFIEAYREAVTK